ncbi:ATP-binding protein [Candidatus Poriferisodalis sp.]|uniref:ATP-binding protein n=1 Tax=Candidatus Poriferisodalis sp. TaxID=3101277 RepID=UPI003C702BAF
MSDTLEPDGYRPRVTDSAVERALAAMPTVVIEGPKGCGKTWTGRKFARSEVLFDRDLNARRTVSIVPGLILDGPEPRLLDEWQLAPEIWNQARHASDEGRRTGRFILTGSAVPADDITRHSGVGRIARVLMRPMSLLETGESTAEVSIGSLLDAEPVGARRPDAEFAHIVEALCRGGWPRLLDRTVTDAQLFLDNYLGELCRTDVAEVDGVARNPDGVARLIASIARNVATTASFSKLAAEASGDRPLNRTTATEYQRSLQRLFVVEDAPCWRTHLRSRATLRAAPKRHFVDPSLAVAALGASPERLRTDLQALGFLFESLVVRDLRIYAQASGATVYHYRDSDQLEADAVIEARDGRWIAAEVKLGGNENIEQAARSLLSLRDKVDTARIGEPSKLLIITATGYGYDRPDGTTVVPISALGP